MKTNNWKVNLSEARKLRKKGVEMLFDRVSLLVECYSDDEFRAFVADEGTNEVDYLDEELSDTAANFLTLKTVIEQYPTKDEWIKHNIRELIAGVMEAEKESRKKEDDKEHRQSWKERAIIAEAEGERLRARVEYLEETLEKFIKAGVH